jgi:cytochrome c biogenesis protein CcdA
MEFVGLAITFGGFLLAAASVGITASTTGRLMLVLIGIAMTLVGILGVINQAYQKDAVWKR